VASISFLCSLLPSRTYTLQRRSSHYRLAARERRARPARDGARASRARARRAYTPGPRPWSGRRAQAARWGADREAGRAQGTAGCAGREPLAAPGCWPPCQGARSRTTCAGTGHQWDLAGDMTRDAQERPSHRAGHGQHQPTETQGQSAWGMCTSCCCPERAGGSARGTRPWPGRGMGEGRVGMEGKKDPCVPGNRCPSRLRSRSGERQEVLRRLEQYL
jgi:hypothetical protein